MWVGHVTYERGISEMGARTSESCHIWVCHVTYEWVMSHMNESCHVKPSWHTLWSHATWEWVMSHMNDYRDMPHGNRVMRVGLRGRGLGSHDLFICTRHMIQPYVHMFICSYVHDTRSSHTFMSTWLENMCHDSMICAMTASCDMAHAIICIWHTIKPYMFISTWYIDTKPPPPPVFFRFGKFPNQEPGGRGPPWKNLHQVLGEGSSSSGFLVREPAK